MPARESNCRSDAETQDALLLRVDEWLRRAPSLPQPGGGATLQRWRMLADIAADDVCVVKVVEAHHDALAILRELDAAQLAGESGLHAVWAAEPPDARLSFQPDGHGGGSLHGTKAWCSGSDIVDVALVTAHVGEQRVLVRVALDQPGVRDEPGGWEAVGMARVNSGRVRFDGAKGVQIGAPGAYVDRPGFWHGGAGIAACWFGAASQIAWRLLEDRRAAQDPHALAHLGAVDMCLSAAASLLRETAAAIDAEPASSHRDAVTRVRSVVERCCVEVVDRVGRALGPAPLCTDGRHATRCADLTTFIRQSHAERDWAELGASLSGKENPWLL